ncbi:ATP-binding protein [Sinorhizobium sp. BG8]|uniref:sensor histidine kinase n=1 Tax=Sinorhizobium sp. BG8 TaxID=2613773 RepID=UPI00193E4534|nr:ATP-binding protein [Sinorhizobium sp. BG8]QRM55600.1 PAS domain S-box protein [Sinorhizobium sp. BG8]
MSGVLELERERQEARDMLHAALETISEGFAIFDREERLILFNSAYRELSGKAGATLRKGMTAQDIFQLAYETGGYRDIAPGSEEAAAWLAQRLADFRNPASHTRIFPYGETRWIRAEDRRASDGNIVSLRVDVTELQQAAIALERQRREYHALLQNVPDLVCRLSPDRTVLFVNDKYASFFGTTADALIGADVLDHVPEEIRQKTIDDLAGLTPDEPIRTNETPHVQRDGSICWIHWTLVAVFDGRKVAEVVSVGRDISDIKKQQRRVEEQTIELQRKNEALNQFTATVSHDLKAPLRHIAMFSDMIAEDILSGETDELQQHADYVRKSALRMQRLVDSLLEYSQIAYQIANRQGVELRNVVDEALQLLDGHIRDADAQIEIGELPKVVGDPELLKRLAQNLIGNAIKYRKTGAPAKVRIYGRQASDIADLVIEDEGIGVDPKFERKIFDVFQRLHPDESVYKGTGIGLALAKRIAESHGGTISLDTEYGPGARFVVTFPISPASPRNQSWATHQKS